MGAGGMEIPSYSRKKRFIKMRDRKSDNRAKEVGCRNGLFLAQNVVSENQWTSDKIKKEWVSSINAKETLI